MPRGSRFDVDAGRVPRPAALAEALGEPADGAAVAEIIGTLTALAARLRPDAPGPIRRQLEQAQLDQARQEL